MFWVSHLSRPVELQCRKITSCLHNPDSICKKTDPWVLGSSFALPDFDTWFLRYSNTEGKYLRNLSPNSC
jgi:hypothetical protein